MDNKNIINLLAATAIQQKSIKELADSEGLHLCCVDADKVQLLFAGFRKLFDKEDCTCREHDETYVHWSIEINGVEFCALEEKNNKDGWYKKKSYTERMLEQEGITNIMDLEVDAIPLSAAKFNEVVRMQADSRDEANKEIKIFDVPKGPYKSFAFASPYEDKIFYTVLNPDYLDHDRPYDCLESIVSPH